MDQTGKKFGPVHADQLKEFHGRPTENSEESTIRPPLDPTATRDPPLARESGPSRAKTSACDCEMLAKTSTCEMRASASACERNARATTSR